MNTPVRRIYARIAAYSSTTFSYLVIGFQHPVNHNGLSQDHLYHLIISPQKEEEEDDDDDNDKEEEEEEEEEEKEEERCSYMEKPIELLSIQKPGLKLFLSDEHIHRLHRIHQGDGGIFQHFSKTSGENDFSTHHCLKHFWL